MKPKKKSPSKGPRPNSLVSQTQSKEEPALNPKENAMTIAEQPEKQRRRMTPFERTMALLTFFGLAIACLTGAIFWQQLKEMRTDQRAWINVSVAPFAIKKEAASEQFAVTVPVTVTNTGKTPARFVFSNVVVERLQIGEAPPFVYKDGQAPTFVYKSIPRNTQSVGVLVPNAPQPITATLLGANPSDATGNRTLNRLLSQRNTRNS